MGRAARAGRWLAGGALLLFVAGLALRPMAETDLFFHLKAGQEIRAHHALMRRNTFSFTYPDYPDLDTSWLAEVGAAVVYGWGGFDAVVVAKTAVLLVAFALLFRAALRGAGPAAAAGALAAAAFVASDRLVERPLVFSFAGEAMVLLAIAPLRDRRGPAAWRAAGLVLAGVAVWANLHAGVFVAPLMLGAAALAAAATGDRRGAAQLALVAAAAAGAMLLTPVGAGLFRYLTLHLELPALHAVDEFRRPSWVSDAPLVLYATGFLVVVAAALAADRRARAALIVTAAPGLPLLLLAAHSVRFGADAALVCAPALAMAVAVLGRRLGRAPARDRPLAEAAVALALLALAVPARRGRPLSIGLDASELPLDAIAFANAQNLRERMYNDFEIGSYLLFDPVGGYPRHRVFVDPRLPAYPPEMHRLLGRADLSRAEWQQAMDRHGVETALLAYAGINRRVAWWDPARWALVWNTGDARLFVRRQPRFGALIAAREIPATFAFTDEDGAVTVPLEAPPPASPIPRCEWDRRLGDLLVELDGRLSARARAAYERALAAPPGCLAPADQATAAAWLGGVDLQAGRPAAALGWLDRAVAAGDRSPATAANRAAALESLGRAADARAAWRDVAAAGGSSTLGARARDRLARLPPDGGR